MDMIATEFLMFTVISGVNAYLPVFLRLQNFTPTEIGYLYGIFNTVGILVPLLLIPVISKSGKYSKWLFGLSFLQIVAPICLFQVNGFALTAVFMALFAITYRGQIPISDSIITQSLGNNREKYGMIRVAGTAGFIVMSLVMQKFVYADSISKWGMGLWFSVPSLLFAISLVIRRIILDIKKNKNNPVQGDINQRPDLTFQEKEFNPPEEEQSTLDVLKGFGLEFYLMLFVMFMEFFGMVPSNQYLSIYARDFLGTDISGLLWAINSIFELPFMFVSGWFIKKFGEKKLIVICTAAVIVRLLIYAFIPSVAGAVLGQCTHCLTYGLFFPACISYCSRIAGTNKKANITGMTLINTVTTLPAIFGAVIGGIIIDTLGYKSLFLLFALFPLFAVLLYVVAEIFINKKKAGNN